MFDQREVRALIQEIGIKMQLLTYSATEQKETKDHELGKSSSAEPGVIEVDGYVARPNSNRQVQGFNANGTTETGELEAYLDGQQITKEQLVAMNRIRVEGTVYQFEYMMPIMSRHRVLLHFLKLNRTQNA